LVLYLLLITLRVKFMILNKKFFLVIGIKIFIILIFIGSMGMTQRSQVGEEATIPMEEPETNDTLIEEEVKEDAVVEESEAADPEPFMDFPRLGASCVTEPSRFTTDVAVAEARHVIGREQGFWEVIDTSLQNEIYLIVNIDNWKDEGRHSFNEEDWRNRVEQIISELLRRGANKENTRITIDNEPMKYFTREEYVEYVNIAYDQIAGRFDMGAGNEEYDLAMRSDNMYEYLCENADFDVLDVHIQSSMTSYEAIQEKGDWYRDLAERHGKRLSVTEANWFDVATLEGYHMLIAQLEKAYEIGAEDFCVVFVALENRPEYEWLSFNYNGQVRNEATWGDFRARLHESRSRRVKSP
jgi:hypothetical protein